MGKKEQNKNNALIDQERNRGVKEHSTAMGYLNPERTKEKQWSDTAREDIYGRYGKFASGDFGPGSSSGSSSGGGGGGYAPSQIGLVGTLADARDRYKGFADTGGYTDTDKVNIRAQGQAPIAGMFEGLNRRMQQGRSAGQASNIGFGDSLQRMAREQSRAGATAARETELGIMDRVNEGKRWGLEGYTGIGGTEQDIEMFNAQARNAAASQGASEGGANERFNKSMQLDAADRMADLWGSQSGELSRYDDLMMAERGMASGQFQGSNAQRQAYNPNFSYMDKIGQGLNIAGGAMGAITGLGGMTKGLGALSKAKIPMLPGRGGAGIPGITASPFSSGQNVNPSWQDRIRF